MDLSALIGSNFTIIIGIFVTLAIMGITTFYDRLKGENKTRDKSREMKPSNDLGQKIKDLSSKYTNSISEYSKKIINLIPKRVKAESSKNNEKKPLKSTNEIPKMFGTIRSKISSFSYALRGKKSKLEGERPVLQSSKKTDGKKSEVSKFSGNEKVSGFELDTIVESKKDELDFDDNVLSEMSTASSIKNKNAALLNSDLTTDLSFDKNEFDIGFGALNDESPEEDSLFNTGAEKFALADDRDSLLDSLKKDIVVTKEKKTNFMSMMEGENLDIKIIKTDLQDILRRLKKYKQYSQ